MSKSMRYVFPKRKALLTIAIILSISFSPNFLLALRSSDENKLDRDFLLKFRDDFKDVLLSPRDWDRGDVLAFTAVAGSGILLFAFDQDIQNWVEESRTSFSRDASPYISKLGNGAYLSGFLAALYASGELFGNNSLRKTALLGLESFVTTSAFVLGLKFIIGRARPQSGESSHSFHPFSTRANHTSFPSGDAAGAWAVATSIAEQSKKLSIDIFSYSLATLVAFYRVHDNKHWASDALIGSALGHFVARKIAALNKKPNEQRFAISFQVSAERQALLFSLSF